MCWGGGGGWRLAWRVEGRPCPLVVARVLNCVLPATGPHAAPPRPNRPALPTQLSTVFDTDATALVMASSSLLAEFTSPILARSAEVMVSISDAQGNQV